MRGSIAGGGAKPSRREHHVGNKIFNRLLLEKVSVGTRAQDVLDSIKYDQWIFIDGNGDLPAELDKEIMHKVRMTISKTAKKPKVT